jgi:hypothetical protein
MPLSCTVGTRGSKDASALFTRSPHCLFQSVLALSFCAVPGLPGIVAMACAEEKSSKTAQSLRNGVVGVTNDSCRCFRVVVFRISQDHVRKRLVKMVLSFRLPRSIFAGGADGICNPVQSQGLVDSIERYLHGRQYRGPSLRRH